jgi:hypothetical protein
MKAMALLFLLIPLALMIAGFWILTRLLTRHGRETAPTHAADGSRVLMYVPRASLRSIRGASAVPGPGTLVLTERHLVFERFFPRRELRVELGRISGLEHRTGVTGESELAVSWTGGERRQGDGCVLDGIDPAAWIEAIERARSSFPPAPGAQTPSPGPPGR